MRNKTLCYCKEGAVHYIIDVLSLVGNFMVIWTIARNRHMRTATNYYILNLATEC